MVLRADVAAAAIDCIPRNDRPLIYLSPRGKQFTQAMAQEWAAGPGVILFCGRFEGLDERVIEARGMQEVAVGEAVLAGGEAAALVLLEACVRLMPGVLGNDAVHCRRKLQRRPAGAPAIHQAPRLGGPRHPRCPHFRRSRQGRRLAQGRARTAHQGAYAGIKPPRQVARFPYTPRFPVSLRRARRSSRPRLCP